MSGAGSLRSGGRNTGVDALRCVAMLLIVCLHVMNRGGALPPANTPAALWLYPLRILASSAVNIYALISGYVMLHGRFRPARIFELWLQVWVLNLVIGLIGDWIDPEAMDAEFWVRYLFPFTQKAYWYFTAYVGVYAFSPLINRGVRALNRVQAIGLLWLMLTLFSLCATLGYLGQGDPFAISKGYSVLWLLALYTVGACVRQTDFLGTVAAWRLGAVLGILMGALTGLYWLAHLPGANQPLVNFQSQMLEYTSPPIAAVSLLMLLLFSRLRLRGRWEKLVGILSPLTFGVYVIHVHHVIWIPLQGTCKPLLKLPWPLLPLGVLFIGLGLFGACAAVDWLRAGLFRLLRVRHWADRLEAFLRRNLQRMIKNG